MLGREELKIQIVEDEGVIALDIKKVLVKNGYQVSSISNSCESAVENMKRYPPDLILMDIMLKGDKNGLDASREIRAIKDIPIIFLSAFTDSAIVQKAKEIESYGYLVKPFDERTLCATIDVALYKSKLEKELKQKTTDLEKEKKKNDSLLLSILPSDTIEEFKLTGRIKPKRYKEATIMFTDFEGFSDISLKLSPAELHKELSEIFFQFDQIVEKYDLEKLKTIGGGYMICGGLPKASEDHALRVVKAAIEMNEYILTKRLNSQFNWEMRTGINSGSVVAGVVGKKKFTYDVWGETVNIASRIENRCKPGEINISSHTYNLIKNHFQCTYVGTFDSKLWEDVDMYSVTENKESILVSN